jgi:hypothetical protein
MPAPLALNWEAVKMLAQEIGIKPAAERLGIMQHYDALCQRSKREQWFANIPRAQQLPATISTPVSCVSSPSAALQSAMKDDAMGGRASALRLSRRKLEHLERKDDDELLLPEMVSAAHQTTKDAALAGGWAGSSAIPRIAIQVTGNINIGAQDRADIDTQWTDVQDIAAQ